MNTFRYGFATIAILLCPIVSSLEVRALDVSETLAVERYTILTGGDIEYSVGNLLRNGRFRVLMTEITSTFGVPIWEFEPISGRWVTYENLYEGYKAVGAIPRWVRSREVFSVGIFNYVIVGVAGKGDPNPIPVFEEQPESETVLLGDNALFFADASPSLYVSYQWRFRNKALPGETFSTLMVEDVGLANVGAYSVEVNCGGKSILSQKATLKLVMPVVIKTQPRSQTVKAGRSVTFRVAVQGTKPFTYQWYFNDTPIPEATKVAYAVRNVQAANAGNYRVVIQNDLSAAVSTNAVLTVVQ